MDAELRQSSVVFNSIGKYRYINRSGVQMNEWDKNYRVLSILIFYCTSLEVLPKWFMNISKEKWVQYK